MDKAQLNLSKKAEDDRDLIISIKEELNHNHPRKIVVLALTTALSDSFHTLNLMIEGYEHSLIE